MVKKVIKDEKVSASEAENKKGFHITIVDLDSGKKTLDIDTKMILGAVKTENGSQGLSMICGNTLDILHLVYTNSKVCDELKKSIVNSMFGGEENE